MKRVIAILLCAATPSWGTISAAQTAVHIYLYGSGGNIVYGSNTTAGNLLFCKASSSDATALTVTSPDSAGNTWSSFTGRTAQSGGVGMRIFYVLSAVGGADTVHINGGSDMGVTCFEYNASGGATWSVDSSLSSGSFFDGSTVSATTNIRTSAWSTAGADDLIYMQYADETNTQATHTTVPANFTEIQWDNGHVDADAVWVDAAAQTSLQSGWDVASSVSTYGLYVVAFTATPLVAATPQTIFLTKGAKVSVQGGLLVIGSPVLVSAGTTGQCMGILCGVTYPN